MIAAALAAAAFSFSAGPIEGEVRERVVGSSWRKGCPVGLADLRYLRIGHRTFDGGTRTGELIVHADAVPAIRRTFARLYRKRFPIRRMRLVDDYGASDYRSIEADNTSAFNCRRVAGTSRWSEHAYGRAIDVNPIENPYVTASGTTRTRRPSPISTAATTARGWRSRRQARPRLQGPGLGLGRDVVAGARLPALLGHGT